MGPEMNDNDQMVGNTTAADSPLSDDKPLVSIIVPAFNESDIIQKNLGEICSYMQTLQNAYAWELLIVNDGSTDETGDLAEAFAAKRDNVFVLHHMYNFRLGQALRYAFNRCKGDYVVVLDLDLSYSTESIGTLLEKIRKTRAKIVIASPFMKGGRIANVPVMRKVLSIWANRFLCMMATKDRFSDKITNITGMVRAYDGLFLRNLNLKATDYNINPEIIYKAKILRARIVEVPATLDWGFSKRIKETGGRRRSGMKILSNILQSFMSGYIFRPFLFFIMPGLIFMVFSFYPLTWVLIHTSNFYKSSLNLGLPSDRRLAMAIGEAFKLSPHAFLVGGVVLLVAVQLISLGFLAYQNKRYFEELFHFNSTLFSDSRSRKKFDSAI